MGPTSSRERWLFRLLIIGGPTGLGVVITLSLWVTQMHLQRSVVLQVQQTWRPGEQLAVRAQLLDPQQRSIEEAQARLAWLDPSGARSPLTQLDLVPGNGVFQGRFHTPQQLPPRITLELEFDEVAREPVVERIPIDVRDERPAATARNTLASTTLQWADDTDPQASPWHIDLVPAGRMLSAFDNTFLVRVTRADGSPVPTEVRVGLVSGEFAGRVGDERQPPIVFNGSTDALGLAHFSGLLASEVVRFDVAVEPPSEANEPTKPKDTASPTRPDPTSAARPKTTPAPASDQAPPRWSRRFRLVSYAGGVHLIVDRVAARPGETVSVTTQSLRRGRRVHIDVHAPDGTWTDSVAPGPVGVRETTWSYRAPADAEPGVVQLEAYPYTNAPGESSALARIQLLAPDDRDQGIAALVARQRARLEVPRVDKHFDPEHERKWLDGVAALTTERELDSARRWLIGTLPIELYGPPLAISTREREKQKIADRKRTWTIALRWTLLGGGGLLIVIAGYAVSRVHTTTTTAIDAELTAAGWSDEAIAEHRQDKRALLLRGFLLITILVASLILSLVLLESLVWVA
ncbi:MAG: hypothetical protein B7733_10790 [Myxococcales bacterium FL481]|nr:MAG: hypothetical protein B7733_10790 [Myxococcales bacterium FL481]